MGRTPCPPTSGCQTQASAPVEHRLALGGAEARPFGWVLIPSKRRRPHSLRKRISDSSPWPTSVTSLDNPARGDRCLGGASIGERCDA